MTINPPWVNIVIQWGGKYRFHLVVRRELLYITVYIFGKRLHYASRKFGDDF